MEVESGTIIGVLIVVAFAVFIVLKRRSWLKWPTTKRKHSGEVQPPRDSDQAPRL